MLGAIVSGALLPSVPAASTTITPCEAALRIAVSSSAAAPQPEPSQPIDRLITAAPWATAQLIPSAMSPKLQSEPPQQPKTTTQRTKRTQRNPNHQRPQQQPTRPQNRGANWAGWHDRLPPRYF